MYEIIKFNDEINIQREHNWRVASSSMWSISRCNVDVTNATRFFVLLPHHHWQTLTLIPGQNEEGPRLAQQLSLVLIAVISSPLHRRQPLPTASESCAPGRRHHFRTFSASRCPRSSTDAENRRFADRKWRQRLSHRLWRHSPGSIAGRGSLAFVKWQWIFVD